jgi:hypothetical protein
MGFNASLVILLDRLDEIERDPTFGKKVAMAIREFDTASGNRTYITGQTQVISVAHADTNVIIRIGGNTGEIIGYGTERTKSGKLAIAYEPKKQL